MRQLFVAVALGAVAAGSIAQSQHWVNPYIDRNGNLVQGHWQTNADGNVFNNWSTQGNVNPYTGQPGTVNPYQQMQRPPTYPIYQAPQPRRCGYNQFGQYVCI